MKKEIRILMLEDDAADAELTCFALRKGGVNFSVTRVESKEEYLRELEEQPPELILSDYSLPGFDGQAALDLAQEKCPVIPFIFVTGTMGEEVAIETLKSGATDYVLKTGLSRLGSAVERALREAHERDERHLAEEQLRQSHEQLRKLSFYLQSVREEERTRIAREVHDELGQALTSCKLDVSWIAGRLPRAQKEVLQRAKALSTHIDSTIQMVRRISTELRPGVLDHLGLVAALEWQATEFQNRTGIRCEIRNRLGEQSLAPDLSTNFFRIFQETLTNIIRHAGATHVLATLKEARGQLILEVRDNGRGITRDEILHSKSMGLLGMRERAALLGGKLRIRGLPRGQGTQVTASIPRRPLTELRDERGAEITGDGEQAEPPVRRAPRHNQNGEAEHENSFSRRSRRGASRSETNSRR